MQERLDNPAGRLHALLMQMHAAAPDQNRSGWQTMVQVLAPPGTPEDSATALAAAARMFELPRAVRAAVAALDVDEEEKTELVLDLDKIEAGLVQIRNPAQPIRAIFSSFAPAGDVPSSAAVRTLLMCSSRLHRIAPEPMASFEDLERLAAAVTDLIEDVQGSQLDSRAKLLLMHHLHALLRAIDFARITGMVPLEEGVDAFVGALHRQPEVGTEIAKASIFDRLKQLVAGIELLLRGARGARELASGAGQAAHQAETLVERGLHALEQGSQLLG
jgi:hypothetical protein